MSRKNVLVLGGNFAGLTAALAVRHELRGDVDVRVVSASDRFLFNPSLIWLPFGKRGPAEPVEHRGHCLLVHLHERLPPSRFSIPLGVYGKGLEAFSRVRALRGFPCRRPACPPSQATRPFTADTGCR